MEPKKTLNERLTGKIKVMHSSYGCDSGCCGHTLEDENGMWGGFQFSHPYGDDHLEWAKEFVKDALGEDRVKDLDFENSRISDD